MSPSPQPALSRRSLLRGAASVAVAAAFASTTSCAADPTASEGPDDAPRPAELEAGPGALLRLAHDVAAGPRGAALSASPPAGVGALHDDDDVVRAVADRLDEVAGDFAAERTVRADGWLLSTTEAATLVAYAGTCPVPSC